MVQPHQGFGFLTRGEGTEDIFVHMETLRRYGLTELRPGQVVLVRFGRGPKGLWPPKSIPTEPAAHLRPIEAIRAPFASSGGTEKSPRFALPYRFCGARRGALARSPASCRGADGPVTPSS